MNLTTMRRVERLEAAIGKTNSLASLTGEERRAMIELVRALFDTPESERPERLREITSSLQERGLGHVPDLLLAFVQEWAA